MLNPLAESKVVALVLSGLLMLVLGCGGGDGGKTEEPEEPATLIFETDPPGATIYWDGEIVGQTPYTLEDVPQGSHTYRIELEGYETIQTSYIISSGGTKRIDLTLRRPGGLYVITEPPGAALWIKGENRGQTPMLISGLLDNTIVVTFMLEGHVTRTDTLAVAFGQTDTVDVHLLKPPAIAEVLFYAYSTYTKQLADEPSTTFVQRDFQKVEGTWDRVRLLATFDEEAEGSFTMTVDLRYGEKGSTPLKFFSFDLEMDQGQSSVDYYDKMVNPANPQALGDPAFWLKKGDYEVWFRAGNIEMGKGTFQVT